MIRKYGKRPRRTKNFVLQNEIDGFEVTIVFEECKRFISVSIFEFEVNVDFQHHKSYVMTSSFRI